MSSNPLCSAIIRGVQVFSLCKLTSAPAWSRRQTISLWPLYDAACSDEPMETPTGLLLIDDRHPFGSPRNTGSVLGNTSLLFQALTSVIDIGVDDGWMQRGCSAAYRLNRSLQGCIPLILYISLVLINRICCLDSQTTSILIIE
jgi:hypothetical protein